MQEMIAVVDNSAAVMQELNAVVDNSAVVKAKIHRKHADNKVIL